MFGFAGRWRPLLYCVFAFYESNLTYFTVPFYIIRCQPYHLHIVAVV